MDKFGFVYKVDFFKEKGDAVPIQNLIFLNAEDCHWIFATKEWSEELIKVEYAVIQKEDPTYLRAEITSKCLKDIKEKEKAEEVN
jgi:hypothetical protein